MRCLDSIIKCNRQSQWTLSTILFCDQILPKAIRATVRVLRNIYVFQRKGVGPHYEPRRNISSVDICLMVPLKLPLIVELFISENKLIWSEQEREREARSDEFNELLKLTEQRILYQPEDPSFMLLMMLIIIKEIIRKFTIKSISPTYKNCLVKNCNQLIKPHTFMKAPDSQSFCQLTTFLHLFFTLISLHVRAFLNNDFNHPVYLTSLTYS